MCTPTAIVLAVASTAQLYQGNKNAKKAKAGMEKQAAVTQDNADTARSDSDVQLLKDRKLEYKRRRQGGGGNASGSQVAGRGGSGLFSSRSFFA